MTFVCNQSAEMLQKQSRAHYTSGSEKRQHSTHPSTLHTVGPLQYNTSLIGTSPLTYTNIDRCTRPHSGSFVRWPMMWYAKSQKQNAIAPREVVFKNKRNILCRCKKKKKKLGGNLWRVTFDIMKNEWLNHVFDSSWCPSMWENKWGGLQSCELPCMSGHIGLKNK